MGARAGELTMVIAPGMDDPLLQARGPYDLLIANILAAPLVELAADFARAVAPGGNVLLAGLLETQECQVRRAYRQARSEEHTSELQSLMRIQYAVFCLKQKN